MTFFLLLHVDVNRDSVSLALAEFT
jgi:hypothetical protein